ncbi:hypothetical protein N3K66_002825 [Trichothecium roseum]|uniref:Uncharacterized protein n=1 Tax=Trichothecium roseum TaxID=47278 RepID=A0ACC0V3Y0_9HYPO|nr:hypothetical protein N3K66_002825 [Trichothecium roseum]
MQSLHRKYGPVVRYGPNQLSYVDQDSASWKAIHGAEKGGREFPKAKEWFVRPSNAFSTRALKRQEPIFQKNIDALIEKLGEAASAGRSINMVEMYQFTTFDIMGHLAFGEPLGLLQNSKYSKWVESVFDSIKVIPIAQIIQHYPILDSIFQAVEPESIKNMKYHHFKHCADRVDRRLQKVNAEADIWSMVLEADTDKQLTLEEMHCHGDVFMLAGSETTGTTLSALTFYLLSNQDKLALMADEIRRRFGSESEMNMQNVAELAYVNACIKEALRLFPPVPVGVPRVVPTAASGQNMPGGSVPAGTRVSVHHYATYHSSDNFRDPDSFVPERWLDDPNYQADNRECFRPFAAGPRNCIGQNMAMYEMQLIVSRIFFKFDFQTCAGNLQWDEQRAFILWDKKPLMCQLSVAHGEE